MTEFALHLLRHGTTGWPGRLLGHRDEAVTEAGVADCVAQGCGLTVARIVCSDLSRAHRCADAIGDATPDPRWRELDFGTWDGLTPGEVDTAAYARFWADPDADPPKGGESWSALVARVGAAIEGLPPVPTLVVTHGGAMRAALAYLCGFDRLATWAFTLPYAARLTLAVRDRAPRRGQITALAPCGR